MSNRPILIAGFILGAFAVGGVGLVAVTHDLTDARIADNEREATLRTLASIIPSERMDNDPVDDMIEISDPELLGSHATRVYRVRGAGGPLAVVLDPVVPDGYAGPIKLLVSVLTDGTLGGVRVLTHRETPGLGDKIEIAKSDWLLDFNGKSLSNPSPQAWTVKRDGGVFDQFAGATITPRSIVHRVKNTLLFVQRQGNALYSQPAMKTEARDKAKS